MRRRVPLCSSFSGNQLVALWLLTLLPVVLLALPATVVGQEDLATKTADVSETTAGSEEGAAKTGKDAGQVSAENAEAVDSPEDPDKVVNNAAEDVKQATAEAVDALKSGDLATAAQKSSELFKRYGVPAIVVLVVLLVVYFVAAFLGRLASTPICKRVDETLGRFVGKLILYLIMVGAVLGVLQYFGIGVTSFAAVIAAAGFAVGLAFQGSLSNFAAGIMLLVFRPFKVGDVVNAAGITAKVFEIDLFHTIFDTPDNRRIIVPNSSISGSMIENISHHKERRVDVAVGVDYTADLQCTRDTLIAAAESLQAYLIAGEGRGFQVALGDLGDSAVGWSVRFWTKAEDYWSVKEQLTAAVKQHLDGAGIGIPYPQMDVHLRQHGADLRE